MQRHKSRRHVAAAAARWLKAEATARAERDAGIPDRGSDIDMRDVVCIDLTSYGGPSLRIEPRRGYIAVRVYDAGTDMLLECAAMKTVLHRIANRLPHTLGARRRC